MVSALADLISLLDVEPLEDNLFRGAVAEAWGMRVFGGQVAGQALVAAGRTTQGQGGVHSLHAYFLRAGDPELPIIYEVDRIRDGKSFATRRVIAIQHGRAIFHLSASFHLHEVGPEHQDTMPKVPPPEEVPTLGERLADADLLNDEQVRKGVDRERPIDTRWVQPPRWLDPTPRPPDQHVWFRANGEMPDDPLMHACFVAYASDLTLLDTAMLPHGVPLHEQGYVIASLDHAMWFHRPVQVTDWMLYHQHSPAAAGARGLAQGEIYTREGVLVVTVIQEGLMRPIPAAG